MSKLQAVATEFLERRLLGECIDRLPMTGAQLQASKADYFLFDRDVIIELKDLVDDREDRVRCVIDKWRRRPGWPAFEGTPLIQDVLRSRPRARQVNQDLFEAATASLARSFEKANRQIRETKRAFGLGDVHGILMLLNESVDILEPKVLAARLGAQFSKRTADGQLRYPHVDTVLIVNWAHYLVGADGLKRNMIISMTPPLPPGYDTSLESFLIEQWAAFTRQPLDHGGAFTSLEDVKGLDVRSRNQPPIL